MRSPPASPTLLLPRAGRRTSSSRESPTELPADLLSQSASRLRSLALLYAFVFFMAGFFPALLFSADRARLFGSFILWGPGVISISVAVLVAAVIRSDRVPLPAVMYVGLAFEVVSSYGIAAAEFLGEQGLDMGVRVRGLSWVAVWTLLFTVVVPTPPRRAVAAALASVSSVPVMIGIAIATGNTTFRPTPAQFFFWLEGAVTPARGGRRRGRLDRGTCPGLVGDALAGGSRGYPLNADWTAMRVPTGISYPLRLNRMAVQARSAPGDTANQTRGSAGISSGGAPRLVRILGSVLAGR